MMSVAQSCFDMSFSDVRSKMGSSTFICGGPILWKYFESGGIATEAVIDPLKYTRLQSKSWASMVFWVKVKVFEGSQTE